MRSLILITLLLCSGFGWAQTSEEKSKEKIKYGIKTGIGLSSISVKGRDFFEGKKVGLVFGGFIRYRISESMVLQPEILFVRKGEEDDWVLYGDQIGPNGSIVGPGYKVSKDHRLSYITIPINIYTDLSEKLKIFYGIEPSFLYSEKNITIIDCEKYEDVFTLYGGVKKMDLGLNLGLSYMMTNTLNLDFKLNQGITKINKEGADNVYNSSIQLTLGYLFN